MAELWQVTLAGLLMDGTPDSEGVEWGVEEIEGWDSADVRAANSVRTGQNGTWGPAPKFGGRPMVVKGWADCPSMAAAFDARDRLHTLTDGMLVRHESVEKQIEVERGGVIRCTEPIDGASQVTIRWQIPLWSHRPFKRATTPVTIPLGAAVGTLNGTGTAPAELQITATTDGAVDLTIDGLRLFVSFVETGTVITTGPGFANLPRTVTGPGGEDLFHLTVPGCQWPALSPGLQPYANVGAAVDLLYYPTYA